jgi:flavin reductase (DIM6/NTAB) family NADH-FMN oxidoreductase RutF/DNA-binding IclR family transcriptional regulator
MVAKTFDSRELRQALGSFVTGVTVITTVDKAGNAYGLTANSFSSVSLDPPLVLWSQSLTAPSHPVFRDAERFAVNILADDQVDISNLFARGGQDKFCGIAVRSGLGGIPLIDGCSAYLECKRVTNYPGGDHAVFLGHVERIDRTSRRPLVFGSGKYMVAQAHDLGSFSIDIGVASLAHLQAVRVATQALVHLSDELDETLGLGVWGNHGPTILRWEESKKPVSVNLRTGLVLPVLTSATGLAFAAYLPSELTAEFIKSELAAERGSKAQGSLPTADDLTRQLDEVRTQGMAIIEGTEEFADIYGESISAMSAPVFDGHGLMILALTAIGHANLLDVTPESRTRQALRNCAQGISRRLGYQY